MRTNVAAIVAAALSASGVGAPAGPQATDSLDVLFAAYSTGDHTVIARTLTSQDALTRIIQRELDPAIERWAADRRPVQATFLLDLALAAHNRRWDQWLHVVCVAREFVLSRPLTGSAAADDRFEIAWHKASVALLAGQRRPDFLAGHGIDPLADRMTTAPPADGAVSLVDPWIALARGFADEQWTIVGSVTSVPTNPRRCAPRFGRPVTTQASLERWGPMAIAHYDEAARHDATRDEALVRKAWILTRMNQPAEALAVLDAIADRIEDPAVHYWSRLFRGRALAVLNRPDEAAGAYEAALAIAPGAPSPAVGLLALELARGRRDESYRWAELVRRPPDPSGSDPWWDYWSGDFRLFPSRIAALREMVR